MTFKLPEEMRREEKAVLAMTLILVLNSMFLAWINLPYFENFWVERSGFLKQLQPIFMLIIAGLSFYRAYIFRHQRPKTFLAGSIFLGLLFCFAFGETITWGQRIFEFKSPEFFIKHNTQGMVTIHNLYFDDIKINRLVFGLWLGIGLGIYGIFGTLLYDSEKWFGKFADKWGIPIARYYHVVALAVAFALSKMVFSGKKGEVLQFAGLAIFMLIFFNPKNLKAFEKDIGTAANIK